MESILGTTFPVYFAVTLVVMGGCAFMTGRAIAGTWRPLWQLFPYAALLGAAARFLIYALFEGELLTLTGYLCDTAALTVIALFAFRITQVHKMVSQYPWVYERAGLFSWREKV